MSHATLSPSSAARWLACPGSVALSANLPDTKTAHAEEGTLAHEIAAEWLNLPIGSRLNVPGAPEEMPGYVQQYVEAVWREVGKGDLLLIEQRLPIGHITGEEGATGTGDAVVMKGPERELQVHDLKYGRGVQVFSAEYVHKSVLPPELAPFFDLLDGDMIALPNPQLGLYGLGAMEQYQEVQFFDKVKLFIHQPRLDHVDVAEFSTEQLAAWGRWASKAACATNSPTAPLVPGEKQCRWCRAKATCPALRQEVARIAFDSLEDISALEKTVRPADNMLGDAMAKVSLVEDWCLAVRAAVEAKLVTGGEVPGYKLVEGRRGQRKWVDEAEVEKLGKSLGLRKKDLFESSLISPATAEKLLKGKPTKWEYLKGLITQSKGKPSVAPATDKRPAVSVTAGVDDLQAV